MAEEIWTGKENYVWYFRDLLSRPVAFLSKYQMSLALVQQVVDSLEVVHPPPVISFAVSGGSAVIGSIVNVLTGGHLRRSSNYATAQWSKPSLARP